MSIDAMPENDAVNLLNTLTERQQLDLLAVMLAYWENRLGRARAELKPDLEEVMNPGDRSVVKLEWPPGSGMDVSPGSLVATDPPFTLMVTDESELMDWAELNYPAEVKVTEVPATTHRALRSSFMKLFRIDSLGRLHGPNGETVVPGLDVAPPGPSTIAVRPNYVVIDALWDVLRGVVPAALDAPGSEPITVDQQETS